MMSPKFKNIAEYEKAQILLQPIYIRLVDNIRKESELNQWDINYEEINEPFPSYIITIKKDNLIRQENLWNLCFQICFESYQDGQIEVVVTDKNLMNNEGEIDWQELDNKTKNLVKNFFQII